MTKNEPADTQAAKTALAVQRESDESTNKAMARNLLEPQLRHALAASAFADKVLGNRIETPSIMDFVSHMQLATGKAEKGDLAFASRTLAAQAITLDAMFTELARRAALNMGEYMDASERYGRLALKAQANSRATLETLAKLHQPREQTVRHVHVNEGGQAVIADQFHHHMGAAANGENDEQSHATGGARKSSALPCLDTSGNGVPISSGKRKAAMQDARRHKPRPA